jgi:serine/threonine protein kinase
MFKHHAARIVSVGTSRGVRSSQVLSLFSRDRVLTFVVLCTDLHLQGYMYRDLKPENILISAQVGLIRLSTRVPPRVDTTVVHSRLIILATLAQGHIRLSDFDLVRPMLTVAAKADGESGETSLLSEVGAVARPVSTFSR